MRDGSATEEKILKLAKKMIIKNGIANLDMKVLAEKIGCSRSTLYRHFSSKGDIMIKLVEESLEIITRSSTALPKDASFKNGFEEFSWYVDQRAKALIHEVDSVTFIRDFDCLYTNAYPQSKEVESFKNFIKTDSKSDPWLTSFKRGMEDGSIRHFDDPSLQVLTISNGLLGLAERVIPRVSFYIKEQGYSEEFITNQAALYLESIRSK
ncbi:MAG: TetR/AcrR family transcriptional regulator [Butyrivibrio sp.]|uniref:TetR/AcrR family transcriptional regulator n=1 Tax=Butyrivibrio sp. TaxID=28121 RepID=UPI0025D951BD|nr:TetR/AcrR family transcriptional regulator [Butyrivibrio sp.]MCR5770800.1 TetR/AcrR family transcriptional regulator [Butyrivibrio sp.]